MYAQAKSESNNNAKTGSSMAEFRGGPAVAAAEEEEKSVEEIYAQREGPLFTEAELEAPVTLTLTETPTMELFVLRGLCVQQDTELHKPVVKCWCTL